MIRVEPPVFGTKTQSFSMILSAGLVIAGVLMWFACGRRRGGSGARVTASAA
jgi:hypothetical protein